MSGTESLIVAPEHASFKYTPKTEGDWETAFLQVLLVHGPPPRQGFTVAHGSVYARGTTPAQKYIAAIVWDARRAIDEACGEKYLPNYRHMLALNFKNAYLKWCIVERESAD
jgi:hypothetical protein